QALLPVVLHRQSARCPESVLQRFSVQQGTFAGVGQPVVLRLETTVGRFGAQPVERGKPRPVQADRVVAPARALVDEKAAHAQPDQERESKQSGALVPLSQYGRKVALWRGCAAHARYALRGTRR